MLPLGRCALLAVALACASRRPPGAGSSGEGPPPLQLPEGVRPIHYAIDLAVHPSRDRFSGKAAIEVELAAPLRVIWLHGRDLRVTSCAFDGPGGARGSAAFEQVTPDGVAKVTLPSVTGPGRLTLRFEWDAAFADAAQAGLFRWRPGGDVYVIAEHLAIDARRVFPGFDEPRFKAPFDVTVRVPASMLAVSNEPVAEEIALPGGSKRVRFATTRPLPTYLLFLAAGPFDVVEQTLPPNDVRRRALPVHGIAPRGRGRELAFALETGAALLADLERWFDMPFPYSKLDHVAAGDYPGAKENAGAILYGADLLLQPPDRRDEEARRGAALLMAHELAHQWFGDLVTAPWFTEAWMNEAFAQLLGYRIADRHEPEWGLAMDHLTDLERVMTADGLASARAIRRPMRSFDELSDQLDGFTYEKGMAVLATFERWIGEERFRAGLREYVREHADATGSVQDLLAALTRAAGSDLSRPFLGFLDKPGIPLVTARVACEGGSAQVHLAQRRYRPRGSAAQDDGWEIPVCVRFAVDGKVGQRCALVPPDGAALELPGCPAWLLPDAGGIGYYRWALAPRDQAALRAKGVSVLSAAERLSFARNARAAQRAGATTYAEAMDTLLSFAGDPAAAVAGVGMDAIRDARDHLLDGADRPLVETVARRVYRPTLRGNGFDAPADEEEPARRRRVELVRFLVEVARDPEVRREAERRGIAYAGIADGRFHPEAVSPELATTALRVALEERGAALYDALLPRLERAEGADRAHLIQALALADSPSLGGRPGALWRDPRLRPAERLVPALLEYDSAVMRRTYAQMRTDLDAMVAAVPPFLASSLPLAARELCDAAQLAEARVLLDRAVERHPSMRLSAARALEQGAVCAAERDAEKAAAKAWFERVARPLSR